VFSLGRLLTLLIVGVVAYLAVLAPPFGGPDEAAFTPATVAEHEVAMWQSARAGEEVGTFISATALERERHRLTWFRAAQAGYHLARAAVTFAMLENRFERVLPDLEAAAAVHQTAVGRPTDPAAIARAQLNWWVTRRMPNLNTQDHVAPLIDEEYELRYRLRPGAASEAAARMADAALQFDASKVDPNVPAITRMLTQAYEALRRTMTQSRVAGRD